MTNRERIINTVLQKPIDRLPLTFYFGPWFETMDRWRSEGLPEGENWDYGLGLDEGFAIVDINLGYCPRFTYKEIEDLGDTMIIRDSFGILQEIKKHGSTIPRYIDYPIKNRQDWEVIKKERLNPNDPNRFPKNWDDLVKTYNNGDKIVQLGQYPYGLFGTLRDMIGVEDLLVMFYDDPELIHDMMDYLTDFWLEIYEKVCKNVKVDAIHIWEDMSGKGGSLISPNMIYEFMTPNYKKIRAFADAHNIPIVALDTDGDCTKITPVFIESGINTLMPFEVASGSDILEYRKLYPSLCIMGGIDKQEIAKGKDAIDKELDRIDEMFHGSGYIASLDHLAHPQISYEDHKYFVKKLKEKIGIAE